MAGLELSQIVEDAQQEPFEPSECEASVVEIGLVGRIVATYDQNNHMLKVWHEDANHKFFLDQSGMHLANGDADDSVEILPAPATSLKSAVLTCTIK